MKRIAAVALALLAPLAFATVSGHKWFPGRIPVHYVVFAHTTINGMPAGSFNTAVLPRIQEAFLNWTATRVACTSWKSMYDGTFTTPSNHTAQNQNDNVNRVIYLGGAEWRYSSSTLGLTTTTYYPTTGEIIDADMELNNNVTWSNSGNFNAYDYESVVLHEAGHFLGLDHTNNVSAAVMYPTVNNGQIKRQLYTTDVNDVCMVYPGTGTGSQGNPCTMASQCSGGLVCRSLQGSTGGKVCTVDCTTNANACTTVAPWTCQNADTGKACLPPAAPADYCKFCVSGADCSSGNCLSDANGHQWCTTPCSPAAPCATGSVCLDVSSGQTCTGAAGQSCVCAPNPTANGIVCPNQCTGTTCGTTPGYGCNAGTCEPTGNEGDRCELSGFCKPCLVCIGSSSAANCRACCGGTGGGGVCTACPNGACTGMTSCVPVSGTNDKICYPNMGADLCQACGGTTTCLNGNTCIGGKCHASCNPQSPGTCGACSPTGATTGLCACPGEEKNAGETCGTSPTIAACRTGLVCSTGTCRTTCVLGNPASCPSGQVCQSVAGVAVCVADTIGTRCAACNGQTCAPGNTCYQGRCYTTCNVSVKPGPCDSSCVDVGGGINVCACDDQIHGSGETCGPNPIAACGETLVCVNGTCLGECNPNTPQCPVFTDCRLLAGTQFTFVCQPSMGGTGGGAGGGGGDPLDCTPANAVCPQGTVCRPNGDGTATCRATGQSCDPNSATNTCGAELICRAVDGSPGMFACQTPQTGNNAGCGCQAGWPGALVALAAMLMARRRK